ncbi:MAG: serine/threonine protein kinase [Polyangiaceae bacterium]|nr:serine/threonine protein kinase [Polyangiaceae bacterium]
MSAEPGTVVGNDFRITEPIAEGGMGQVFAAEQISTGKRRALKLLKRELLHDDGLLARFEQEAKIGAQIDSDHVVEVVAAGVDAELGVPWIAMELLQGETLAALLARRGRLPPDEVRVLFAQIAHAVGAAHRVGVVHRDLKPENVFVARVQPTSADFKVKLLDFGIAKLVDEAGPSKAGMMPLGTPRYMAPEQTGGQPITPQTDVWALGLLAFRVLTGRHYWKHAEGSPEDSMTGLVREILFEPLVTASRRATELGVVHLLPPSFDAWFGRCVAREPSDRFRNATEAQTALDPLLAGFGGTRASAPSNGGVAVQVAPGDATVDAGAPEKIEPRRPRRRLVVILAAVLGVGVVAGGGYGVVHHFTKQNRAKRSAAEDKKKERAAEEDRSLPANVSGVYDITKGTFPASLGQASYVGTLTLTSRTEPDIFKISWSSGTEGIALRSGNVIGAAWGVGPYGVAVYDVERGTLTGRIVTDTHDVVESHVLRGAEGLSGVYRMEDASQSGGSVRIMKTGDTYSVKYVFPTVSFEGTGLAAKKKLVVGFSGAESGSGVAIITRKGKTFETRWAMRGADDVGKETLKKK